MIEYLFKDNDVKIYIYIFQALRQFRDLVTFGDVAKLISEMQILLKDERL